MSVSNQTDKIYGSGNGVTTVFSFPFKVFDSSQLYVYLIQVSTGVVTGPLTLNSDYTISISSVTEGGTITFTVAPPTGYNWFVKRLVSYTQAAVIPTEGALPGLQISNQLDLITMMAIQTNEAVTRCAQLATTSLVTSVTLPDPVDGYALTWSGTSGLLVNFPITATALTAAIASTTASAAAALASKNAAATSATAAAASATAAAASAVTAALSAVPSGGIIMWKGSIATIPSGWVLCNGSNSTPDLRNLFIVGADADVGGVAKSTVSGSAAQTGGAATHTHTEGSLVVPDIRAGSTRGASVPFATETYGVDDNSGGSDSDTHRLQNVSVTGTVAAGSSLAPYYALAYIMKT